MTKKVFGCHLRDLINELESRGNREDGPSNAKNSVDQVQVSWMIHGDPQYAFFLAGTNDEIDFAVVPRSERRVAHEEGVQPETVFGRRVSESTDSRILEEHVLCSVHQADGECARDQGQTLEQRVTFNVAQEDGKLLCRCQELICDKKNQELLAELFSSVE